MISHWKKGISYRNCFLNSNRYNISYRKKIHVGLCFGLVVSYREKILSDFKIIQELCSHPIGIQISMGYSFISVGNSEYPLGKLLICLFFVEKNISLYLFKGKYLTRKMRYRIKNYNLYRQWLIIQHIWIFDTFSLDSCQNIALALAYMYISGTSIKQ